MNRTRRRGEYTYEVIFSSLGSNIDDYEINGVDSMQQETTPLLITQIQENGCDVCDSLWWDSDGQSRRFTETEIGLVLYMFAVTLM